jgi:hypothetical protein
MVHATTMPKKQQPPATKKPKTRKTPEQTAHRQVSALAELALGVTENQDYVNGTLVLVQSKHSRRTAVVLE